MSPFLVLGLPRSRTYWLSRFLTYGRYSCGHEHGRFLRTLQDARSWLAQDCVGSAETSVGRWWKLARHLRPDLRILVVRRPVDECVDSIMRLDMEGVCTFDRVRVTAEFARIDRALDRVEREDGVISVRFRDLNLEHICAAAFEHCLPYEHDHDHWQALADTNLQASMPSLMRYFFAHKKQLTGLMRDYGRRYRSIVQEHATNGAPRDLDGIVIEAEPFEQFWRDGQRLFAEHIAEVGSRDGVMLRPNVDLARKLEAADASQILVARRDGEMIGYLATIITPSLENDSLTVGVQNTFFVTKSYRGIGPRMQSESISRLRARGVGEVVMRAGVRGCGPKLASLFERMGAEPFGELYSLRLA